MMIIEYSHRINHQSKQLSPLYEAKSSCPHFVVDSTLRTVLSLNSPESLSTIAHSAGKKAQSVSRACGSDGLGYYKIEQTVVDRGTTASGGYAATSG